MMRPKVLFLATLFLPAAALSQDAREPDTSLGTVLSRGGQLLRREWFVPDTGVQGVRVGALVVEPFGAPEHRIGGLQIMVQGGARDGSEMHFIDAEEIDALLAALDQQLTFLSQQRGSKNCTQDLIYVAKSRLTFLAGCYFGSPALRVRSRVHDYEQALAQKEEARFKEAILDCRRFLVEKGVLRP